jgi:hypothetical protein
VVIAMYACVFCQTHYCANDCQFLDSESSPMDAMTPSIATTLAYALYSQRAGYTIRRDGTVPTTGVAVADHTRTETYSTPAGLSLPSGVMAASEWSRYATELYRARVEVARIASYILANDAEYYGIWVSDNVTYLDCVTLYPSTPEGIRDAVEFGRLTGELAVFDLATGLEYMCRVEDAIVEGN